MILNNQYLSLILQKSVADLISESRRGYVGILWWVIEPVLYMAVFYVIFVILFKRGDEDAVSSLLIGLVVWKWFASSLPQCANCIAANMGLIRQVYIPKTVFPSMVVLTNSMKFLITFMLLVIFLIVIGDTPSMVWLSLPVLIFVQLLLILSIGCVLAAIVPFFPDLKLIIDNVMMLLFFLSGVFFDISSMPIEAKMYLSLNPMVGVINSYRDILIKGVWPDWNVLVIILIVSLMLLVLGRYLLCRFDRTFAKVI